MSASVALLYEHPTWFAPLFDELDRRRVDHEAIDMTSYVFDPTDTWAGYDLVVNRMSPSAGTRGHGRANAQARHLLAHLDRLGVPIVNGPTAFAYEMSKAAQLSLFSRLGVNHPRARVIADPGHAPAAARGLAFPVLVKPNVGGSGAGIRSFADADELADAARTGLDLGPDGTALVQERLPPAGDAIVRLEILDGGLLYAIRLELEPGTFNLCPADYCRVDSTDDDGVAVDDAGGPAPPVTRFDPPRPVADTAIRIVAAADMDVGGVEYLVNERDGQPYFYDVNALSNFVADPHDVLGFEPHVDLVHYLMVRAGHRSAMAMSA